MRMFLSGFLMVFLFVSLGHGAENGTTSKARTFVNASTCGKIIADIDKTKNRRPLAMIVGSFISGSNYAKNRNSMMELKNMMIVTENFCRKNPQKPFMASLVNLDRVIDRQIKLSAEQ